LETVFEVKNLKSVLDPDENISIDVPKNCPLLRGDVKFRLTRNEQGIFCKEKAMAVFWNGFRETPSYSRKRAVDGTLKRAVQTKPLFYF